LCFTGDAIEKLVTNVPIAFYKRIGPNVAGHFIGRLYAIDVSDDVGIARTDLEGMQENASPRIVQTSAQETIGGAQMTLIILNVLAEALLCAAVTAVVAAVLWIKVKWHNKHLFCGQKEQRLWSENDSTFHKFSTIVMVMVFIDVLLRASGVLWDLAWLAGSVVGWVYLKAS
jgi:hypothetical protein